MARVFSAMMEAITHIAPFNKVFYKKPRCLTLAYKIKSGSLLTISMHCKEYFYITNLI